MRGEKCPWRDFAHSSLSLAQWHSKPSTNVWPEDRRHRRTDRLPPATQVGSTRRPLTVDQTLPWTPGPAATVVKIRLAEFVVGARCCFSRNTFTRSLHSTLPMFARVFCIGRYTVLVSPPPPPSRLETENALNRLRNIIPLALLRVCSRHSDLALGYRWLVDRLQRRWPQCLCRLPP